jgi:hypothetical protein
VRELRKPLVSRPEVVVPGDWVRPRALRWSDGTRGFGRADRHLVCGAGPFELELVVQHLDAKAPVRIAGLVTRGGPDLQPVANLELWLVAAGSRDSEAVTRTDAFGEFEIRFPVCAAYGLRLGAGADAPCILVWQGAEA